MEILDRYLNAVQFWLPKDQKRDIIAELSEDIHSEIDEQERALGRTLNNDEVEAILKRRGDPLGLAQRYLPQRHLIGPRVFPIYWLIVRSFLAYFVGPWLLVWLCLVVFAPNYRLQHPGLQLIATLGSIWTIALNAIIGLTLAFAIIERYQHNLWPDREWNPRALPPARDPNEIRRCSSIGELVWIVFVILWWRDLLPLPGIPDLHITLSQLVARYFYWPILLALFATAILAAFTAVRPRSTRRVASYRLVVDIVAFTISSALIAVVVQGGSLVAISSAKLASGALATTEKWFNWMWLTIVIPVAISYLARAYQDYRRATGKGPSSSRAVRLLTGEC